MNDSVTKSKVIAFKDLVAQSLSPRYYEMMEEKRKRWAAEDAAKQKNEK